MCGLGGLPPWGGPALLSGNGVKPQERGDHQQEACLCWEGSKPVLQRRGRGSPGIQDSEPSPGPWGTARWASLSSLTSHGLGAPSDTAQGPPTPRSPARPGPPSTRQPQALLPTGRPRPHCLSPAEKGCPGTPRSLSLAACPPHSRPPGPGFP